MIFRRQINWREQTKQQKLKQTAKNLCTNWLRHTEQWLTITSCNFRWKNSCVPGDQNNFEAVNYFPNAIMQKYVCLGPNGIVTTIFYAKSNF